MKIHYLSATFPSMTVQLYLNWLADTVLLDVLYFYQLHPLSYTFHHADSHPTSHQFLHILLAVLTFSLCILAYYFLLLGDKYLSDN